MKQPHPIEFLPKFKIGGIAHIKALGHNSRLYEIWEVIGIQFKRTKKGDVLSYLLTNGKEEIEKPEIDLLDYAGIERIFLKPPTDGHKI